MSLRILAMAIHHLQKSWSGLFKLEIVKEFTRKLGIDPEKILVKDALSESHRIIAGSVTQDRAQFKVLGQALREWI